MNKNNGKLDEVIFSAGVSTYLMEVASDVYTSVYDLHKDTVMNGSDKLYNYDNAHFFGYDKDGNPIWRCSSSIVNDITGIIRVVFASSKKNAKKAVAYLMLCEHLQIQNQYGPNDFLPIWDYKNGRLTPNRGNTDT